MSSSGRDWIERPGIVGVDKEGRAMTGSWMKVLIVAVVVKLML
jgi:hypothetical protein